MALELEVHLVELEQGGLNPFFLLTFALNLLLSLCCVAIEVRDIFASYPLL